MNRTVDKLSTLLVKIHAVIRKKSELVKITFLIKMQKFISDLLVATPN